MGAGGCRCSLCSQGVTPLHLATFDGSLEIMKYLISSRPDLMGFGLLSKAKCCEDDTNKVDPGDTGTYRDPA